MSLGTAWRPSVPDWTRTQRLHTVQPLCRPELRFPRGHCSCVCSSVCSCDRSLIPGPALFSLPSLPLWDYHTASSASLPTAASSVTACAHFRRSGILRQPEVNGVCRLKLGKNPILTHYCVLGISTNQFIGTWPGLVLVLVLPAEHRLLIVQLLSDVCVKQLQR